MADSSAQQRAETLDVKALLEACKENQEVREWCLKTLNSKLELLNKKEIEFRSSRPETLSDAVAAFGGDVGVTGKESLGPNQWYMSQNRVPGRFVFDPRSHQALPLQNSAAEYYQEIQRRKSRLQNSVYPPGLISNNINNWKLFLQNSGDLQNSVYDASNDEPPLVDAAELGKLRPRKNLAMLHQNSVAVPSPSPWNGTA